MAKVNVLTDLQRTIASWQHLNPGPLPMAMGALKEVVDRKLNMRPSASRYNKAICIGYHAGCNYDKAANTIHANSSLNTSYFRHSNDDRMDMETKCGEMWDAVQAAQAAIPVSGLADDNRTLKIFMGPEFFFRGKNGAYSPDIVSEIIPRMRSRGTANASFENWLFVFGTAVAAIEDSITFCTVCPWGTSQIRFERNLTAPNPADRAKTTPKCSVNPAHAITTGNFGAEVQNVALIQHGSNTHMVAKEYVSGIDYKNNEVRVHPGSPDQQKLDVLSPVGSAHNLKGKPVQHDERLGGCIFTVDGITIGLEVCLDHALAPPTAPEFGRASALAPTIQILLIPSYGMTIGHGLHCKAGGIAFNVDGRGHGNSEVKLNAGARLAQTPTMSGSIALYGPFNIPV